MRTKSAWSVCTTIAIGALAGVAGGVAEIAWISTYAVLASGDAESVARGVTDAVRLGAITPFHAMAGIIIHIIPPPLAGEGDRERM